MDNPMNSSSEHKKYYDESLILILFGNPEKSFWLRGFLIDFQGYEFEAKVYDLGSEFGIEEGRISKLAVFNASGETVIHYDRGWNIMPGSSTEQEVLDTLVKAFRSLEEL